MNLVCEYGAGFVQVMIQRESFGLDEMLKVMVYLLKLACREECGGRWFRVVLDAIFVSVRAVCFRRVF